MLLIQQGPTGSEISRIVDKSKQGTMVVCSFFGHNHKEKAEEVRNILATAMSASPRLQELLK